MTKVYYSKEDDLKIAKNLIEKIKSMKKEGFNLYDSDEYLDDIYRFISKDKIKWREKLKCL